MPQIVPLELFLRRSKRMLGQEEHSVQAHTVQLGSEVDRRYSKAQAEKKKWLAVEPAVGAAEPAAVLVVVVAVAEDYTPLMGTQ